MPGLSLSLPLYLSEFSGGSRKFGAVSGPGAAEKLPHVFGGPPVFLR